MSSRTTTALGAAVMVALVLAGWWAVAPASARADELQKARVFSGWAQAYWETPGVLPAADHPELACHGELGISWTTTLDGGLAAGLQGGAAGVAFVGECRLQVARDWWAQTTDFERCEVVFHEVGHLTGRTNHTPHTIMDGGEYLPEDFLPCAEGLSRQAGQARLDRLNARRAAAARSTARAGVRRVSAPRAAARLRRGS